MNLPLDLQSLRAMSDELIKISMDAGGRATLAGKLGMGRDYLVGGELPSNSPKQDNFVPKIAEETMGHKAINVLHKARDPAMAAFRGAGGGILLGQLITGGQLGRFNATTRLGYRGLGGIGAGLGLLDYYTQPKPAPAPIAPVAQEPPMAKVANLVSSTFSPARQLSEGVQTGSFKNMIHSGGRLRPLKVGQKFEVPSEPK